MGFMEENLDRCSESMGALFIMTTDPQKVSASSTAPFALIDHASAIPSEQEILFPVHTVFHIEDIQQTKENKRVYEVQLTLTNYNDSQLTGLTQRMREDVRGVGWHRMGQLMLQVSDFNRS